MDTTFDDMWGSWNWTNTMKASFLEHTAYSRSLLSILFIILILTIFIIFKLLNLMHMTRILGDRWQPLHSINITFEKEISRLFYDNTMFLTNILLKRVKSKRIMVQMESVVSGHRYIAIRDRLAEKLEVIKFDPFLQTESLYREKKKIRSMK